MSHERLNCPELQIIFPHKLLQSLLEHHEQSYLHSIRVGELSRQLASSLRLSPEDQRTVWLGGLFHDIGKLEIPPDVLDKSKKEFIIDERKLLATHADRGEEIARKNNLPEYICKIIKEHSYGVADDNGEINDLRLLANRHPLTWIVTVCDVIDTCLHPKRQNERPDNLGKLIYYINTRTGTVFPHDITSRYSIMKLIASLVYI